MRGGGELIITSELINTLGSRTESPKASDAEVSDASAESVYQKNRLPLQRAKLNGAPFTVSLHCLA